MRMVSPDLTIQNIEKIGALFPNCVTETVDENGKEKKGYQLRPLRQMLTASVIDGDEAYEFTWVGKKPLSLKPISQSIRHCVLAQKKVRTGMSV